jgi:NAD-dependent SIR2 family protein deacetylase
MPSPPSSNDDGAPPRKKRKLTPADPKERTTERLDLTNSEVDEEQQPQLQRLLNVLHKKRKIVVIAGAGISVSAGIPDFRSATGLFNSLKKEHKLKSSGKDLFDASVYQDDNSTSTFHDMVRTLSQHTKSAKPTAFHHLLATLAQEGRLMRLYTQNVDGIDTSLPPLSTQIPFPKKGPWPKTVQLHGGLDYMVCSKCHNLAPFDAEKFDGPTPPPCPTCVENDTIRQVADKRSHGIGRLRPRMVLYNEHNPDDESIGSCAAADMRLRPDAVIVAGTTLKVPGVRRIAREMCKIVRDRKDGVAIWVNNDPEPLGKDLEDVWDLVVNGPCDEVARHANGLQGGYRRRCQQGQGNPAGGGHYWYPEEAWRSSQCWTSYSWSEPTHPTTKHGQGGAAHPVEEGNKTEVGCSNGSFRNSGNEGTREEDSTEEGGNWKEQSEEGGQGYSSWYQRCFQSHQEYRKACGQATIQSYRTWFYGPQTGVQQEAPACA